MSIKITLTDATGDKRRIEARVGESIYEALSRLGVALTAPCGGRGKCGKCKVRLKYTDDDSAEQTVLACQTVLTGNCEIKLATDESKILTQGKRLGYEADLVDGYSLAVDIGTTTIAAYLLEASSGKQLAAVSHLNPQRIHGADVISRISYAAENGNNSRLLQSEMTEMLDQIEKELLDIAGLSTGAQISSRSLVGNTAMMHLVGGFDTSGIAKAPYWPQYTALHTQCLNKKEYLLGGCISGYVGADTLAAMIACDLDLAKDNVLLIDIGTNGELVLKSNGRYSCCSCAAGPAFEGAHISCGTGAVKGAIDHLRYSGEAFEFSTIGSEEPKGICGSGIVDAVAYLLDNDCITPVGRMRERFQISEQVYLDPEDIREVQLAKAAIASGIQILSDRAGIGIEQIDRLLLAGGFGNYIDVHSACKIGLLPKALEKKIIPVGNAAGDGAKMIALSGKERVLFEDLRKRTEYIELSMQEDFEDIYTDNLIFETD